MAVYTHLSSAEIGELIAHYDVGNLVSAKGIAEGVSNSNWLIETARPAADSTRFILTIYEERTNISDLPFFLDLLDHLAAKNCPVPRTIHDQAGRASRLVGGKVAALIEYLPGVSIDIPNEEQAFAVGRALANIHAAAEDFGQRRKNDLGLTAWRKLLTSCGPDGLASIHVDLAALTIPKLDMIARDWPTDLRQSVIHSDLFPDNVLILDNAVSGLIDFYFACNDVAAYDLAVTHAAWSFSPDGSSFNRAIGDALIAGYQSVTKLTQQEKAAMPMLGQAAAMRFIATRAYDWLNTPAEALVTRKDPMEFVNRLRFYDEAGPDAFSFAD